ncbi:MAG: DUF362 domain-containing protein [archaeon]|nr:MAG: DUF362 domain-containing protein [archaeon]
MRVGNVFFEKVKTFEEFKKFIDQLNLQGDTFIIKPNWVEASKGHFTEATPLEWILRCLNGRKIVIESHTAWRNKPLLEKGEELVDEKNMDDKKDFLREQDKWFLESTGIKDVFKKYNVEYVNITEECWKNEVVDPKIIQELVEKKFSPVKHKELYATVPKKLWNLKNPFFIDFAKIKTADVGMTLSTKNLFGLIPDPKRSPRYHDHEMKILPFSVLDMNKIYRALFNSVFINEGIFRAIDGPAPLNGRLKENLNLIVGGKNSIDVDLVTAKLVGIDPQVLLDKLLNVTKDVFGSEVDLSQVPEGFADKLDYKK